MPAISENSAVATRLRHGRIFRDDLTTQLLSIVMDNCFLRCDIMLARCMQRSCVCVYHK